MKHYKYFVIAAACLVALFVTPVSADDGVVGRYLDSVHRVGSGTYEVAFWEIYDVTLYAEREPFNYEPPYALAIVYKRSFTGKNIADRSAELIREQGFSDEMRLAGWHNQMVNIFPDVEESTELVGVFTNERHARFYFDGEYIGSIRDPEFGEYFFNIWLGAKTRADKLRRELLGSQSASVDPR